MVHNVNGTVFAVIKLALLVLTFFRSYLMSFLILESEWFFKNLRFWQHILCFAVIRILINHLI